jgi:hypothetical protein
LEISLNIDDDMLDQVNQVYIDARYPADFGILPKEWHVSFHEHREQHPDMVKGPACHAGSFTVAQRNLIVVYRKNLSH